MGANVGTWCGCGVGLKKDGRSWGRIHGTMSRLTLYQYTRTVEILLWPFVIITSPYAALALC